MRTLADDKKLGVWVFRADGVPDFWKIQDAFGLMDAREVDDVVELRFARELIECPRINP